jgi:hypothetical protein
VAAMRLLKNNWLKILAIAVAASGIFVGIGIVDTTTDKWVHVII